MFRFAFCLIVLMALIVGSVAALAAPDETDAVANAGWEEMGVGSASGGGISNNSGWSIDPSVGVGPNGMPIVAWVDDSGGNPEIYVRRWNGSIWVEIGHSAADGGVSNNPGYSVQPVLVVDPGGTPIVAWLNDTGSLRQVYARRWNGSDWVEMAYSGSGGGISNIISGNSDPSLAIDIGGTLAVAWDSGNGIYLRWWNGLAWVELGGSASGSGISNTGSADRPSVAFDGSGMPIVAWVNFSDLGLSDIYVRRWNGSAWVEMGSGSASGGGISNTSSTSWSPSLAVGSSGLPTVAWLERSVRFEDSWYDVIYVRRWNGLAWEEMGNSASGLGISSADSADPSLAIGHDGAPIVAWSELNSVYVRRWNGRAWGELEPGLTSDDGFGDGHSLSLAISPNGVPVIAWGSNEGKIYVRRFQPCYPFTNRNLEAPVPRVNSVTSSNVLFLPTVLNNLRYFELEPNNNASEANGPICSGRIYTGLPNDRYDVFALDADAGFAAVNLTNHVSGNIQLQLHHQTITPNPIAIDTNGADGYRLEVLNAPAGRYYIVISTMTPDPDATTRYQLTTSFNMSR